MAQRQVTLAKQKAKRSKKHHAVSSNSDEDSDDCLTMDKESSRRCLLNELRHILLTNKGRYEFLRQPTDDRVRNQGLAELSAWTSNQLVKFVERRWRQQLRRFGQAVIVHVTWFDDWRQGGYGEIAYSWGDVDEDNLNLKVSARVAEKGLIIAQIFFVCKVPSRSSRYSDNSSDSSSVKSSDENSRNNSHSDSDSESNSDNSKDTKSVNNSKSENSSNDSKSDNSKSENSNSDSKSDNSSSDSNSDSDDTSNCGNDSNNDVVLKKDE